MNPTNGAINAPAMAILIFIRKRLRKCEHSDPHDQGIIDGRTERPAEKSWSKTQNYRPSFVTRCRCLEKTLIDLSKKRKSGDSVRRSVEREGRG
jgi:hypothetical protein